MKRKHVMGASVSVAALVIVVVAIWRSCSVHEDPQLVAPGPQVRSTIVVPTDAGLRGTAMRAPPILDEDPAGTLRLEGQVVDGDGHGVAGATVVLAAKPARSVVTEADGSFAFEHLVGRRYTMLARAGTSVAGPITTWLTAVSVPVVLRLVPGRKITVTVVDRDGAPVAAAVVELRGIDEQRALVTGKTAVLSPTAPGNYQLAAWAPGMARTFRRIQIGAADAEATLVLSPGAPVAGRVVDARGNAVRAAIVSYGGASDWSQQADDRLDGVTTADDGRFRFDALPAGSFRFSARHGDHGPGTSALITLDGAMARDDVEIVLLVGATVRGRVVDSEERAVAGARVRIGIGLRAQVPGMRQEEPRQAYSDAQGMFEIKGLPRRALLAGARAEAGVSRVVPVDTTAGDVSDVTLTLVAGATIAGTVVDTLGLPVEGVQVIAEPGNAGDPRLARAAHVEQPEAQTDASGAFALTGLSRGLYRLSAIPPWRAPGRVGTKMTARAGDTAVRLVVAADGAVKGRVVLAEGGAPGPFSVVVAQDAQSFAGGDGAFVVEGLAPETYKLEIRALGFETRAVQITVEAAKTTDLGTVTVTRGRRLAGIVVSAGRPVQGATVYAGNMVFGTGATGAAPLEAAQPAVAFDGGAKTATTDAAGAFSMSGFVGGDVTVIAEHETVGRSRARRLPAAAPGQTELTITLESFGALSGTLRQRSGAADGSQVTAQATSTPGAVFRAVAGADGAYRFDRLAPDVYKVSAMLRVGRSGSRFYSQQVTILSGKEAKLDLQIDPGTVTLQAAVTSSTGAIGMGVAWLASGTITASTLTELHGQLASAGPQTSHRLNIISGEPKQFTDLGPGAYTLCVTPLPRELRVPDANDYLIRHSDSLATFCKPVSVAPSPSTQSVQVAVEIPPLRSGS